MSIHQLDFNGKDKVEKAIMRLQAYEPEEGYFLCIAVCKKHFGDEDLGIEGDIREYL